MTFILLGIAILVISGSVFVYLIQLSNNTQNRPVNGKLGEKVNKNGLVDKESNEIKNGFENTKKLFSSLATNPTIKNGAVNIFTFSKDTAIKLPSLIKNFISSIQPVKEQNYNPGISDFTKASTIDRGLSDEVSKYSDIDEDSEFDQGGQNSRIAHRNKDGSLKQIPSQGAKRKVGFQNEIPAQGAKRKDDFWDNIPLQANSSSFSDDELIQEEREASPQRKGNRINKVIHDNHENDEEGLILDTIHKIKQVNDSTAQSNSVSSNSLEIQESQLIEFFESSNGPDKITSALLLGDLYGQMARKDEQKEMYLWVIKRAEEEHVRQIAAQKLISMR